MERRKLDLELRKINVDHMDIPKHLANIQSDEILKKKLLAQNKCLIRLYMISAYDLSSRDNGSPSDPYLYINCNDRTYNERNDYQLDEANPDFFKLFEFEGIFPGSTPLKIDVFDYDDIFGDDLIGTTIVDIEDRYFSFEWQSLEEKPIEYR
jgi:Ca2+-dependent lipid-binding protein